MLMLTPWRPSLGPMAFALALAAGPAEASEEQLWRFKVYLNDSEIGYHDFRLRPEADRLVLDSKARFNVKVLFFNAYTYAHDSREIWEGGCLTSLKARTDDNGQKSEVQGALDGDRFRVQTAEQQATLPRCTMSFAYWNPAMLGEARLLNAQTGRYLPVSAEELARESLLAAGRRVEARRYALETPDGRIDLWYGDDDRWLGLQSEIAAGRTLRYELQSWPEPPTAWLGTPGAGQGQRS
jgi:hypothetical protein